MRDASSAEWLIARFTDRNRASSIVGDLLEGMAQHGKLRFWLAVSGVLITLTWRRAVGFVAALYLGLYALGALQAPIYGIHSLHRPPHAWMPFFSIVSGLGTLLWVAAPYAAIRFGLNDSFAQIAMAVCGLFTITVCFSWMLHVAAGVRFAGGHDLDHFDLVH